VDRLLRQEREGPLTDPTERTFAFLKPDTVRTRLVGEVLGRLERKGFSFRHLKLHHITRKEAEQLYSIHKGKPFFQELVDSVTSGPVVMMVLEGPKAVDSLRLLIGATNPLVAVPGTIRGDLSVSITANVIHASDSIENAKRESAIFSLDA
jgi:nucleoside-diphosphate kinase